MTSGTSDTDDGMVKLDVLDCKICFDFLTAPIYQCKNGHVVCKTCCQKLKSKCAICRLQIDCSCRLLEEIIESLKVKCKNKDYGCKDLLSYCNRDDHEKNCICEPYPCPQPACHFRGLSNYLSQHFCTQHALYTKTFRYSRRFALALSKNQKIYVLKEMSTGDLFVLDNTIENSNRNKVRISSVRPSPSGRVVRPSPSGNSYKLEVGKTAGSNVLKFCGRTNNVRSISDEPNASALLIVPNEFLESKDMFRIHVKLFPAPLVAYRTCNVFCFVERTCNLFSLLGFPCCMIGP